MKNNNHIQYKETKSLLYLKKLKKIEINVAVVQYPCLLRNTKKSSFVEYLGRKTDRLSFRKAPLLKNREGEGQETVRR